MESISHNLPSRVVTRQPTPSAKADTFQSENLLPPVQIQEEDPANVSRRIASSRRGDAEIFVSHKWGHYEPIVDKPVKPEIPRRNAEILLVTSEAITSLL